MPNQEKHFSVFKFATNIYMDLKNSSRGCFIFISFLKLPLYMLLLPLIFTTELTDTLRAHTK